MITDTPPLPEFELHDGDTLRLGDLAFDVLHTPGHSPGHVCLHEKVRAACTVVVAAVLPAPLPAPLLAPLRAAAVLVVVPRHYLLVLLLLLCGPVPCACSPRPLRTSVGHAHVECRG